MGAITDIVRRTVPASYKALCGVTNTYDFGITQLQALADHVQYRLFSTVPGASNEVTIWNLNQQEFIGIVTTIKFIPAAIDYWGDALQSQATSGTSEDATYFDRRPELWKIYQRLVEEAQALAPIVGIPLTQVKAHLPMVSYGDNGRGILITSDPMEWPEEFLPANPSQLLAWTYGE